MTTRRTFITTSAALLSLSACAVPPAPTTATARATRIERIALTDGRTLEVLVGGAEGGYPLVLHHGTPGDCTAFSDWDDTCRRHGFRLLCASRPGYGSSTRRPGRSVGDVAGDTAAMLDRLGHSRFATLGWSGGGPHALACAALLPTRCSAVATMAGVGVYGARDLDFLAGMGPENVDEFGAAIAGEATLRRWMAENGPSLQTVTGEQVSAALGGLVSDADKAVLTGAFAEHLATVTRRALAHGFDGWIDDDLAFVRPWGFELSSIRQPVTVWQGERDLMVPLAHGRWLIAKLPGATARIMPGQGHLSLGAGPLREQIVGELRRNAGA